MNKIEDNEPIKSTEEKNTKRTLKISEPLEDSFEDAEYFLSEIEYKKGEKYFNGDGVKQDYEMALRLFIKSAKVGNTMALYKLGVCYEQGIVVDLDEEKAIHYYRKAAEQGNDEARSALKHLGRRYHSIGLQYFEGNGVEQDYQTAIKYFHKAADLGDEEAQMAINSLEPKQTDNHGDEA